MFDQVMRFHRNQGVVAVNWLASYLENKTTVVVMLDIFGADCLGHNSPGSLIKRGGPKLRVGSNIVPYFCKQSSQ